jgi:hypothetical protein
MKTMLNVEFTCTHITIIFDTAVKKYCPATKDHQEWAFIISCWLHVLRTTLSSSEESNLLLYGFSFQNLQVSHVSESVMILRAKTSSC